MIVGGNHVRQVGPHDASSLPADPFVPLLLPDLIVHDDEVGIAAQRFILHKDTDS